MIETYVRNMAAFGALAFVLSGCATIVEGTTQSVSLESTPVDGAKCQLQNSEGAWFLTTPGSVVVHKTKNDLIVTCNKEGYQPHKGKIGSSFGATTVGNIVAGGIIGLGIDAASGANYHYSTANIVTLIPLDKQAAETVEPVADPSLPPIM